MNTAVIEAMGVSKKYTIGEKYSSDTLWESAVNLFRNRGDGSLKKNEFWALKDINFTVSSGEILGIIGRNGSGKSTLLKIIGRITPPTSGQIRLGGKVTSLLEFGTGFNPELTGAENIFLNGAILGMSRRQIQKEFTQIVRFAEVEKFLDTPVKHYSSGMYTRLAFAVAAHLKPEILLIDEVLSVGDYSFQKKSLAKMEEIAKGGRAVLFVSHSPLAVRRLCRRCVWLDRGRVKYAGSTEAALDRYLREDKKFKPKVNLSKSVGEITSAELKLESVKLLNPVRGQFFVPWDEPIKLELVCKFLKRISGVSFAVGCLTVDGIPLFTVRSSDFSGEGKFDLTPSDSYKVLVTIYHNLRAGSYQIAIGISSENKIYYYHPSIAQLSVLAEGRSPYLAKNTGLINCKSEWILD